MLWTYLVPNEFYIFFICKHDNFNVLKKLSLKYQNASEFVKDFVVENSKYFPRFKEYFKRNLQVYQCIYATLFPKYFCRVDDYGVKTKVAFDIAYRGYKNEQEDIHFVREMPIKQEVMETSERVETYQQPPWPFPASETEKKECKPPKKRNAKRECEIISKIAMKQKKCDEKKARLLSKLDMNDLHMERINSNVCKK